MAKLGGSGKFKKLNAVVVKKLQKISFLVDSNKKHDDVQEGHFTVIAVANGENPKRFNVPLDYLTHPKFKRLLEQAADEYGFGRGGALEIPCRPVELERLLAEQ